MQALQLTIEGRHKQGLQFLCSPTDFSLSAGVAIDAGLVVESANVYPYCLDDPRRQVIFVELPPDIDLTKVPFVHESEYENAQQLFAVPYDLFVELADALPDVRGPIFIYTMGRAGSTLLSHVFTESGAVASLSEPDVINQFIGLRRRVANRQAELLRLVRSCVSSLFKQHHSEGIRAHALKLRNEGADAMDFFQTAFPGAKNLFLYRDAVGWVTSFARLFRGIGWPEQIPVGEWPTRFGTFIQADISNTTAFLGDAYETLSIPEQLAVWWIASMEWPLTQVERGIPVLSVRYDDLVRSPEKMVRSIFAYCGLPTSSAEQGLRAFEEDAQAGTSLARRDPTEGNKLTLGEDEVRSITEILRRHPVLNTPGFLAPGTVRP